jgi:hypothetical protein
MALGLDLAGTLSGQNVQSAAEAQQQQALQALQQQAQQAAQQSQQAGQTYQQAAQAPAPQLNPWDQALPGLLGNVASIISGNQQYAQTGKERVQQAQKQLLDARDQNLQGLRDVYTQKAEAARQLKNLDAEQEFRAKLESVTRAHETVLKTMEMQAHQQERTQQQQADLRKEAVDNVRSLMSNYITGGYQVPDPLLKRAVKLGIVEPGTLPGALKPTPNATPTTGPEADNLWGSLVTTTRAGSRVIDLSNLDLKSKKGALEWAANQTKAGTPTIGVSKETMTKLRDVETARGNIDDMDQAIQSFLPDTPEARVYKGPLNQASRIFQTQPDLVGFQTYTIAAIQQLKALAGGPGSGLRINKAEIDRAMKYDIPKITDTLPAAQAKLSRIKSMLDRTELPFTSQDWRKKAATTVRMQAPTGEVMDVDPADVRAYTAKGAKVIR